MSSVLPNRIFLPIFSFVYPLRLSLRRREQQHGKHTRTVVGARSKDRSCLWENVRKFVLFEDLCNSDEDEQESTWYPRKYQQCVWCWRFLSLPDASVILFCTAPSRKTTRYDFEANKKNNLIFYGLPSDPRETPNSLVTKVEHMSFADLQKVWILLCLGLVCRFK